MADRILGELKLYREAHEAKEVRHLELSEFPEEWYMRGNLNRFPGSGCLLIAVVLGRPDLP
jgi:hypothetical protein